MNKGFKKFILATFQNRKSDNVKRYFLQTLKQHPEIIWQFIYGNMSAWCNEYLKEYKVAIVEQDIHRDTQEIADALVKRFAVAMAKLPYCPKVSE